MQFDVIIGNPPYQENIGSGIGNGSRAIYPEFIDLAISLNPKFISMIIPARWFTGGVGVAKLRDRLLTSGNLQSITYYPLNDEVFDIVRIAGGVMYFLWNKDYTSNIVDYTVIRNGIAEKRQRQLDEYSIFIGDNIARDIISLNRFDVNTLEDMVQTRFRYGIPSNYSGQYNGEGSLPVLTHSGMCYIARSDVNNIDDIEYYRAYLSAHMADGAGRPDKLGRYKVYNKLGVLEPNKVCSDTYLVVGKSKNLEEIENIISYLRTKTVKFLVMTCAVGVNISRGSFRFVPMQDFTHSWTDEMLYSKYGFTQEQIDYIESIIR